MSEITRYNKSGIEIDNVEGLKYLETIEKKSVNLILTDPPYITSKKTGMDEFAKLVKNVDKQEKLKTTKTTKPTKIPKTTKTEKEWDIFKGEFLKSDKFKAYIKKNKLEQYETDESKKEKYNTYITKCKDNYIKYGSIYGKKYAVVTDYGDWDKKFTIDILKKFIKSFYEKLKDGGTLIMFFDLWKIGELKEIMETYKFKQIRFIEWIKTNPQPLNSKTNYLTNSREIALIGVKKGKPTFNSKYDNGIYEYPIQGGKNKFHPTQKNLKLFEDLIKKHSNEDDIVLDTFLGSGTTAIASLNTNRKFKGCEVSSEYYKKMIEIIDKL